MLYVTIDGVDGMLAIHDQLAEALQFPSYYGRNLDALWDCLGEVHTDVTFVLRNYEALGSRGLALRRLLQEAAERNPHLHME